jgi:hypothetical protein
MDTLDKARLAVTVSADRHILDGAWWPYTRVLGEELIRLFAAWPAAAGYISRVVVSPRDWDDRPTTVDVPHRRGMVKIALLPSETAHQVVLIMLDGQRRSLVVIPPGATEQTAARYLGAFGVRRGLAPDGSEASLVNT